MNAISKSGADRSTLQHSSRRRRVSATLGTAFVSFLCAAQLVACGGGESESDRMSAAQEQAAPAPLPPTLWRADGLAATTPAEARPADPAARWSAERYASREQLAFEQTTAAPYTVILEADDEVALAEAFHAAALLRTFNADPARLGVFVRSRQPALAARLAERLTREQGWLNVFVVV